MLCEYGCENDLSQPSGRQREICFDGGGEFNGRSEILLRDVQFKFAD